MKSQAWIIGVGVGSFFVFLFAMLPARLLSAFVPAGTAQIVGLTGTLWHGNAQTINAAGLQFRDTDFEISPLGLLAGRLSLSFDGDWGTGYARGDVSVGLTGSLSVHNLEAAGPLAPVLQMMNLQGNSGELSIRIDTLEIIDDWPRNIIGFVRVGNLPLSMIGVSGGVSGNYELRFDVPEVAADGSILGELTDLGGPLQITGVIRLSKPRNYSVDANIKPRPDAPNDLKQGLMLIGAPEPDGSREFVMTGSF